jgi:tRNA-dihydrouridine synthase
MYKGSANWNMIGEVKNNPRIKIPIFGNGDVETPEQAKELKDKFGVDGIMIGRASIGYPWVFNEIKHYLKTGQHLAKPTLAQRAEACRTHLLKSVEWKGEKLGILEMRRHYANYFRGLPDFKQTRTFLVTTSDLKEILETIDNIAGRYESVTV